MISGVDTTASFKIERKVRLYPGVDICKFFFSICVLLIHTGFDFGLSWIKPFIYRLAVPFFFCASGFFLGEKIYKNCTDINAVISNYICRLGKKLLVFEPISLIILLLWDWRELPLAKKMIECLQSILFYPKGALWYIQATIVAVLILWPLLKRGKEKYAIPAGVVLYGFALICNRYFFLVEGTALETVVNAYRAIFVSARNGLFFGLLYVSAGMCISKNWERLSDKKFGAILMTLIGFLLLAGEICLLQGRTGIDDNALFLSHLIVIPSLFIAAAQWMPKTTIHTKAIRNLSTSIYLLHSPIKSLLDNTYKMLLGAHMPGYMQLITTSAVIAVICFAVYKTKRQPFYDWIC